MPNVFKADVPSLHSTASPEDGPGALPSFLTLTHAPNASLQQIAHEQVLSPGRVCLAQVPVLLGRMLVKERLIPMQPAANLPPLLHPLVVIPHHVRRMEPTTIPTEMLMRPIRRHRQRPRQKRARHVPQLRQLLRTVWWEEMLVYSRSRYRKSW